MRVATITAPRVGIGYGFCEQTLRDLVSKDASFRTSDLGVFVDHAVAPKVPDGTYVHMTPPTELSAQPNYCIRLTINLARALEWISETGEVGCVFEDDVIVSRDWYARVKALANEAKKKGPSWLITLHHFYQLHDFDEVSSTGCRKDRLMLWCHPLSFYGNQGLCMNAEVARAFAATLRLKMALPFEQALPWYADMGINRLTQMYGVNLFSVHPCLCQHVGNISVLDHKSTPQNAYFDSSP